MPLLTNAEIAAILNREVYSADARFRDAHGMVDSTLAEPPNIVQQSDGNQRIINAIKEENNARHALARAVKRNSDFAIHGIIPEDLKKCRFM